LRLRTSLSLRLTLWFCGVFLTGYLIFGLAMWFNLAYTLGEGRDRTVAGRGRRLEATLEASQRDSRERSEAKFDDFAQATPEGQYIQVFDTAGHRVYPRMSSPQAIRFPWPTHRGGTNAQLEKVEHQGRSFRVFSKEVAFHGAPVVIFVAGNLEDNRTILRRFSMGLLWAIPGCLVLSTLVGYFLSRRALLPISRLIASARSTTIGNLSRRLPIPKSDDEIRQLAETWNEMLSRLDQAVGQITRFTSDASHELRSPMSVIRTTAEYALRNPRIDDESGEAFSEIVAESEEASRLLEDMLTLARSDNGHAGTVFEPVELSGLIAEVVEKIRPFAEAKNHELTLALGKPILINGDTASLRRLIWILVDNAIKFTSGGGRINVQLKITGDHACLSVSDNGVGIPEASLPHIFERFYRFDPSRSQEGTGLGLAIAKWIAEVHGATIRVKSRPHSGSTFAVDFRPA